MEHNMNRVNDKDTRPIIINEVGQSQISCPLTEEERDRLLVGVAIQIGLINSRTFRCPKEDTSATKEDQSDAMKTLYNKVYDETTGEWITDTE